MKNLLAAWALCLALPCSALGADDRGDTTDTIQPTPKNPEPTEAPYTDNLLGDMGGVRNALSRSGVEMLLEYKGDLFSNRRGGLKQAEAYIDNLDLRFDFDNEKLLGLASNKAALHITHNGGSKPGARLVGNTMGIDNIEPTKNGLILYEVWDDQSFLGDTLSVRAGIWDLNNEFMITESSLDFLQPTMQMGQTLAQSGANGPSTFPYTTLGARVKYLPTDDIYAMAAVYNGVSGDPDHLYGNTRFQFDGGAMLIAETGYTPKVLGEDGKPDILAIGGWMYTKRADDLLDVDAGGKAREHHSWGAYVLSSHLFYNDSEGRKLNAFFRPSIANDETLQVEYAYEIGVMGQGWVPTREEGEFGLGLAQAINGDNYRAAQLAAGTPSNRSEYALEVFYRDKVIPGLALQPDLQYIVNPGTAVGTKNAVVVGLRVDLLF